MQANPPSITLPARLRALRYGTPTQRYSDDWGNNEQAYRDALMAEGKGELSGLRREDLAEVAEKRSSKTMATEIKTVLTIQDIDYRINAKEQAEIARLYRKLGDTPGVCKIIGEMLPVKRKPCAVSDALERAGVREKRKKKA
jgi:hypothetical protein